LCFIIIFREAYLPQEDVDICGYVNDHMDIAPNSNGLEFWKTYLIEHSKLYSAKGRTPNGLRNPFRRYLVRILQRIRHRGAESEGEHWDAFLLRKSPLAIKNLLFAIEKLDEKPLKKIQH